MEDFAVLKKSATLVITRILLATEVTAESHNYSPESSAGMIRDAYPRNMLHTPHTAHGLLLTGPDAVARSATNCIVKFTAKNFLWGYFRG